MLRMWKLFKKSIGNGTDKKGYLTTSAEGEQSLKLEQLFHSNIAAPDQVTVSGQLKKGPGYSSLEPVVTYVNDLETSFLHESLKSSSELNDEAISWIIFEFKKHLILNVVMKDLPFYNRYHIFLWREFRKSKAAAGYTTLFKNLQTSVPYIDKVECSTDVIDTRSLYEVVYELFFSIDIETTRVLGPFKLYTLPNYMRYDYLSSRNNYLLNAYHRSDLIIPEIQTFIYFIIKSIKEHCEVLDQNIRKYEEDLEMQYNNYRTSLNNTKTSSQLPGEHNSYDQSIIAIGDTNLLFSSLSSVEDCIDSYTSAHHSNRNNHSHTDTHSPSTSDSSDSSSTSGDSSPAE